MVAVVAVRVLGLMTFDVQIQGALPENEMAYL